MRDFLVYLANRHPDGWDGLILTDAKIPSTTASGWRYGPEPVSPSAIYLLQILRAAGVLTEDYRLPDATAILGEAQQAVAAADRKAQRLEPPARSDSAQSGKKRSSR